MNHRILHIIFILFVGLVLSACQKDDLSPNNLGMDDVILYQDKDVDIVTDVVAGNGNVLIVYSTLVNNSDSLVRTVKLVQNDGTEIWTKSLNGTDGLISWDFGNLVFLDLKEQLVQVIFDKDGSFTFFSVRGSAFEGRVLRLIKINIQGEVVLDNHDFLNLPLEFSFQEIAQNSIGNYFFLGKVGFEGKANFAEYTPDGIEVFNENFETNSNSATSFTSMLFNPDGTYTVGGYFQSYEPNTMSEIIICTYSDTGALLWSKTIETIPSSLESGLFGRFRTSAGRKLFRNENGSLTYLVSASGSIAGYNVAKLYEFSAEGEMVKSQDLDFLNLNVCSGADPFFGNSIIQRNNGAIIGLVNGVTSTLNENFNSTINYIDPHYSYYYEVNNSGDITKMDFVQSEQSNYFTAIEKLSNGNIMMVGTTLSLGLDVKLIAVITS